MQPCHCCQNRRHLSIPSDVPKLLRYNPTTPYFSLRSHSPETDDRRRVSVIKTPIGEFPPRRTNSVSSVDQYSVESFNSDRSVSPITHPLEFTNRQFNHHQDDFHRPMCVSPRYDEYQRERMMLMHKNHRQQIFENRDCHEYRDIPSPNHPISPLSFGFNSPSRCDFPAFNFTPYLEHNLRHKFTELSDFSIKKRHRTIFTPSQLRKLEEKFNENNFIVGIDRSTLAKQLKLKEHQVKIWFQNRRTKVKQQGKDKTITPGDIDVIG